MNSASAVATLALAISAAASFAATPTPAPALAAGWTGTSRPLDVIHARGKLMENMELLMQPIDTITVQKQSIRNADALRQNATVIGGMLAAAPHLFPPTTNLYDPKLTTPPTIALPAIWKSFDSFYALAQASVLAASGMSEAQGDKALRTASLRLRASCDACHALYLRKYEMPKASASDSEFDFDAALGNSKK